MAINFLKHREALLGAWKDVVDDSTTTDWALFGYEKKTDDLTLVEKGDGGLSELLDELNSGKIMYAFCRVLDPNTSLHKFVLINWQGEGAPLQRKGGCANHIHDVCNFFKGAHVTINARTEDDVEPSAVLEKVAKSTGSKFNFQDRSEPEEKITPVSSVYKRIQPSREINAAERENFWMKEQEQEKRRVEEEKRKAQSERKKLENEIKERELKEAMDREERVKERSRSIAHVREAEHNAQNTARNVQAEKMHWERQMQENARDESERRFRSDHVRRERSQEAQALISQRKINARAIFEQNSCVGQMSHFGSQSSREDTPSWTQQQQPPQSTPSPTTTAAAQPSFQAKPPSENAIGSSSAMPSSATRQTEERYTAPQPTAIPPPVSQAPPPAVVEVEKRHSTTPTSFVPENSPKEIETNRTAISPTENQGFHYTGSLLPPRQESEIEPCTDEEPNWDEPSLEDPAPIKDPLFDMLASRSPQSQGSPQIITADGSGAGLRARALYDYQAADDTEISFDPDEVITHIEQIDEGWWQGMSPDGSYGLFPANYVQLID